MLKKDVLSCFTELWKNAVKGGMVRDNDLPAKREGWNNYIDGLQKDGYITENQINSWVHPFN